MKTRQQSLHDEGWQSRAGKESDAQKLDDVRVAEGAHKLTFPHELRRGFGFSQEGVDCFGGGAYRNDQLLHFAVSPTADFGASAVDVGENEGPQPWMIAEKLFSHYSRPLVRMRVQASRGYTKDQHASAISKSESLRIKNVCASSGQCLVS